MCFFCAQIICDTWMSPSWAEVKETKQRIERRTSKNKGLRYRAPKRRSAEPKLCTFGERRWSHLPRVTLTVKPQAVTTWSMPQTKSKGPAPFCKKLLQCSIEWLSLFFLINLWEGKCLVPLKMQTARGELYTVNSWGLAVVTVSFLIEDTLLGEKPTRLSGNCALRKSFCLGSNGTAQASPTALWWHSVPGRGIHSEAVSYTPSQNWQQKSHLVWSKHVARYATGQAQF